jgi:hypothetical protein
MVSQTIGKFGLAFIAYGKNADHALYLVYCFYDVPENGKKSTQIAAIYFLPKSAGISPQFSVSHFRILFSQVLFFNHASALSIYSNNFSF